MITPEALASSITAAAISISKGKSTDELNLLGAMFSQLGDTLALIATQRDIIESKQSENSQKESNTSDKDKGITPQ